MNEKKKYLENEIWALREIKGTDKIPHWIG
jgi:hypothetical protein